jgi:hypothetical protein
MRLTWEQSMTRLRTSITSRHDVPRLTTTTERKLMAKIDWHILPVLCVLYLLAFLDRLFFCPRPVGKPEALLLTDLNGTVIAKLTAQPIFCRYSRTSSVYIGHLTGLEWPV